MEMKPVKIFVYKDRLESMKEDDFKRCLKATVEDLLIKPYHYVIRLKPLKKFDFSKAVPVEVDMDWVFAEAWEETSKKDKIRFLSLIDEELPFYIYFETKKGGK